MKTLFFQIQFPVFDFHYAQKQLHDKHIHGLLHARLLHGVQRGIDVVQLQADGLLAEDVLALGRGPAQCAAA